MIRKILFCFTVVIATSCSQLPTIVSAPVSHNGAVIQLVEEAQDHSRLEQYAMAEAKLERALRLEPKNAALWFELAFVKKDKDDLMSARSVALRAKSFSTSASLTRNIELFIEDLK